MHGPLSSEVNGERSAGAVRPSARAALEFTAEAESFEFPQTVEKTDAGEYRVSKGRWPPRSGWCWLGVVGVPLRPPVSRGGSSSPFHQLTKTALSLLIVE